MRTNVGTCLLWETDKGRFNKKPRHGWWWFLTNNLGKENEPENGSIKPLVTQTRTSVNDCQEKVSGMVPITASTQLCRTVWPPLSPNFLGSRRTSSDTHTNEVSQMRFCPLGNVASQSPSRTSHLQVAEAPRIHSPAPAAAQYQGCRMHRRCALVSRSLHPGGWHWPLCQSGSRQWRHYHSEHTGRRKEWKNKLKWTMKSLNFHNKLWNFHRQKPLVPPLEDERWN